MHAIMKAVWLMILAYSAVLRADGSSIGKVYMPYVNPLETEIEYQGYFQSDKANALDKIQLHKLGLGHSLSDTWYGEIYVIGEGDSSQSVGIEGFEAELKIQLTEQGEFSNDWGLLFELERNTSDDIWESKNTLIVLHQWGKWVGTLNGSLSYEWGDGVNSEFESAASGQMKYRYQPAFEPGLEIFISQDTRAIGPILGGAIRLGGAKKLLWTSGILFGASDTTADTSFKLNIEYEF